MRRSISFTRSAGVGAVAVAAVPSAAGPAAVAAGRRERLGRPAGGGAWRGRGGRARARGVARRGSAAGGRAGAAVVAGRRRRRARGERRRARGRRWPSARARRRWATACAARRGAASAPGARREVADVAGRRRDHALCRRRPLDPLARGQAGDLGLEVGVLTRSSVPAVSTRAEMPELSLSSETCMATIPPSMIPISQIHARPRRSAVDHRWSGSARRRSKAPVEPRRGAGRADARPGRRRRGRSGRRRAAGARGGGGRGAACGRRRGGGGWPSVAPPLSLRAARRRADFERGFAATSPALGATERRKTSSASGVRPQPQTGRSGGQMQPRVRSARKRLTRRSSSEWKEIAGQAAVRRAGSARRAAAPRRAGRAPR